MSFFGARTQTRRSTETVPKSSVLQESSLHSAASPLLAQIRPGPDATNSDGQSATSATRDYGGLSQLTTEREVEKSIAAVRDDSPDRRECVTCSSEDDNTVVEGCVVVPAAGLPTASDVGSKGSSSRSVAVVISGPRSIDRRSDPAAINSSSLEDDTSKGPLSTETPVVAHVAAHYEDCEDDPAAPWYKRMGVRLAKLIPHGGLAATTFNFVAATIGAGVLGLPQAMQQCGVVLGTLLLCLVCACTVFSIRLLIRLFDETGLMTYEELAKNFVHRRFGDKLAAFIFIAFCWGTTVVYVVTMSDILGKIAEVDWFPPFLRTSHGHQVMVSAYWLVVFLPLSLCKEVNSLRYISFAGILATLYLVGTIVVHDVQTGTEEVTRQTPLMTFDTPMLAALPVFIFSYCNQVNAFEIYTELRPRTMSRLTRSVIAAMLLCTIIYGAAGVAGALNFGTSVRGNILKNYSVRSSYWILVTYIGVAINLASSYPLCIYPTRDAIVQMMGYPSAYATPTWKRIVLCIVLATLSLIAGLFAPGIQVLFGLLGGICGSSVGFIFPAVFALRSGRFTRELVGTFQWLCIWLLLLFGIGACIFGTTISIQQTVQNPE